MADIEIIQFRVGESNYNYLLFDRLTRRAIAIDPLDAKPVLQEAKKRDLKIQWILNTHGHPDHVAGNAGVQRETRAEIMAGEHESVENVQRRLRGGEKFSLDGIQMEVHHTPGHTHGHICLVVNQKMFVAGDTLFFGGCGNCKFGGNPDDLFETLEKIKRLPDHLSVYCGHEYTEKNLQFCRRYGPQNPAIEEREQEVAKALQDKLFPSSTLGEEKTYNVFLRASDRNIYENLLRQFPTLAGDPRSVFKKLRELRNSF